jgi:hypothetical protein
MSVDIVLTCLKVGVKLYCAFCGKEIDSTLEHEGFAVTHDGRIYHTECYMNQVYQKRLNQA